ncbi:hypothetical protein MMC08_006877, partial [Hypocenomyce scalaris]|nr:hypothetical protein [Hypocenomyce scalaris]
MGGPQYTSYSISPTQPSRRILPSYTGQDPMSNMPMQLQRHQDSDSAQAGSSQLPPLPADPAQARTPSLPTPPQQQAAQPRHKTSSRRSSSHAKSPRHDMRRSTSADRALPAGAPAAVQHSPAQQGSSEPVARAGPSTSLVSGSAVLDTMGQGSVVQGSDSHSGSRGSGPAGSTASSWLHSHSAHQLTANVRTLAAQVVTARSKQAQELAILKLYAVLSQAHFVKQQAADWEGAFLGILALGFPLVLKHTAEVVIHPDKGYSDMEANPGGARYSGAQGPTIHENEAWDAIMPTQQSFGGTETA